MNWTVDENFNFFPFPERHMVNFQDIETSTTSLDFFEDETSKSSEGDYTGKKILCIRLNISRLKNLVISHCIDVYTAYLKTKSQDLLLMLGFISIKRS